MDEASLLQRRRFEDDRSGIAEEFLQPSLGLGKTVAVLSRPLGPPHPMGWVVCHSFGLEQIHLSRLDVTVARALSASGFPVLRYHGSGYGDSELGMEVIGLASHMDEAADAVELLREQAGVDRVGVLGARFGGTVAALVADRLDLPFMALFEPMTNGAQYMRDLLRTRLFAEMAGGKEETGALGMDQLRHELAAQGWLDVKGLRLARQAYDDISEIDLQRDLRRFHGRALLIGVTRSGKASPALSRLSDHLRTLGGESSLAPIRHALAPQFGQFHFQTTDGGAAKLDTQYELDEKIAENSVAWSLGLLQGSARVDEVSR
jgi:hypothetical protein